MTITLTLETELLLRQKAEREGSDVNAVADVLLATALRSEDEQNTAIQEGVRRGLADVEAGRVRPFAEFAAEMRSKHNLPTHLTNEELEADF